MDWMLEHLGFAFTRLGIWWNDSKGSTHIILWDDWYPVRCADCGRWITQMNTINLLGWVGRNFCRPCARNRGWRG